MSSPERIHKTGDVFGINRELPLNYTEREAVDSYFIDNLTRDKHIVVYGSSKQGKTSLRKHCLDDNDYIVVHCSNKWGIGDLHSALLKRAGYDVIQSNTKTQSGKNKIIATLKAAFLGSEAGVSGETERTTTENVYQTQNSLKDLGETLDAKVIVKEVVNQQTGRYNSFITQFASGFQDTALQMHKWLLYPILTAETEHLEKGLTQAEIRKSLQANHPLGKSLNTGNLTQALQACASLQVKKDIKPIILDYDQTNLRLNVVDLGFLIWLDNQDRGDLLEVADLPRTQGTGT